jgi:SAM-dependent methyltransferase
VALADHDGALEARDEGGRWLVVNKWGRLGPTFEESGPSPELFAAADRVMAALRAGGVEPFITYGTLLGAVREGTTIAHDDDIDLAYLSRHENPSDAVLESFALERRLGEGGFHVRRLSGGHLQLLVPSPGGGEPVHLDVYTSFVVRDHVHQAFAVRAPLRREDVVPLVDVTLDGRPFPAPRAAQEWLAATYGPGWRSPDPAFRYAVPPDTARRLYGWLGDLNMHREYWEHSYRAAGPGPAAPSRFAAWASERLPGASLLELGSGGGADAVWLAGEGRGVVGVDYAEPALAAARALADRAGARAEFREVNLYRLSDVLALTRDVGRTAPDLYVRGLLNALDDGGRAHVLRLLRVVLRAGGQAAVEVRVAPPEGQGDALDRQPGRYEPVERLDAELADAGAVVVDSADEVDVVEGEERSVRRMVLTCR